MEVILVIDDEEVITSTIRDVLEETFGDKFIIKTFTDPEKAIKFYREHGPVKRIILDLTMPKISGVNLIPMIRRQHKDQAITIITGKNDPDIDMFFYVEYPEYNILRKPFTIDELINEFK